MADANANAVASGPGETIATIVTDAAREHPVVGVPRIRVRKSAGIFTLVLDLRRASHAGSHGWSKADHIIENGVMLIGMPGWGQRPSGAEWESWKPVLYIRSLRPNTRDGGTAALWRRKVGEVRALRRPARKTPRADLRPWKKTPMANGSTEAALDAIIQPRHQPVMASSLSTKSLVYGSIWKQRYRRRSATTCSLPDGWIAGSLDMESPYNRPVAVTGWTASYLPDNSATGLT